MIDAATLRSRLNARITAATRAKLVTRPSDTTTCQHTWANYRQTVVPESAQFKGSSAHFIVRACAKCRTKLPIDYVVER